MRNGMDFFTTDLDGVTLINPDEDARRAILESVGAETDADYPEVYLTSGDGVVLGYRTGGVLFQEEEGEIVRLIRGVDIGMAARAWSMLAAGDEEALEGLPWTDPED